MGLAQVLAKLSTATEVDGFVSTCGGDDEIAEDPIAELLSITMRLPDLELAPLLRNLLGGFVCSKCGKEEPVKSL